MMKTTIEMAKECDLVAGNAEHGIYLMALQRFAELVRADERAQRTWVGLSDEDLANCSGHEVRWALYWEKLLKERNT